MIEELEIQTVATLQAALTTYAHDKNWVFRGQAKAQWPLDTTIRRYSSRLLKIRNLKTPLLGPEKLDWAVKIRNLETELFQVYKQNNIGSTELVVDRDILRVLAHLQHYGCPTRLLDFTWLPYVALYFAVSDRDCDSALYAVRTEELEEVPACSKELVEYFWGEGGADDPRVLLYRPNYSNARIKQQKGVFLVPSTNVYPFQTVASRAKIHVVKHIIPARLRSEVIVMLASMNIGPSAVYPEREGTIKSFAWDVMAETLK